MEQLDPKVVALAKAIRQAESNGNFTVRSKDGSFGAYQFLKETWDRTSKKFGVKAQWDKATPQQQNEVAYKQLKEWKDKGFNVGQIASMWNAGSGRPNAYLEGKSGTNKSGVNYNVSKYAEKVATMYQQFVGNPQFKTIPKTEAPIDTRQQMIDSGQAVGGQKRYERTGKADPSFGGSIVRGIVKPLVSAGLSVAAPFAGKEGITVDSKYLGQTSDILTAARPKIDNLSNKVNSGEKTMAGGVLGVLGTAAVPALDLLGVAPIGPIGAVGKTAIGAIKTGQSAARTAGQVLKTSAIRGGGFAGAYDAANQLSSGEKYNPLQTAGAVGVGTALDLGLSRGVPALVNKFTAKGKAGAANKIIANREKELATIEGGYKKLRTAQEYSKDANAASRKRVASTDVLTDATDNTGTIRTTSPGGAVDQYKSVIKLDDYEATVRENLARLGEKVSLKDVEQELNNAVNKSGLEGADLRNALNNIKKEIAGYRLKADKGGMIPLTVIHDAKISTTRGINYLTPPEVKAYRKAVASGLRKTVQDKSNVSIVIDGKTYKIKDINAELSKFYEDITYLENLDGRKVKGGKLGKYFAQTVGAMVGSHFGPFGTIIGAELGGNIKGSMLSKTLGGKTGYKPPTNKILEKASEQGKLPQLQLPAPKPGAPKTQIGSGKPIPLPAKNPLDQGVVDANYSKSLGNRNTNQSTTITPTKKLISEQSTKTANKSNGGLLKTLRDKIKTDGEAGFAEIFTNKGSLTTKILSKLEGKTTVSKQYISDLTNSGDLKQVERDLIRDILERETTSKIPKELEPLAEQAKKYKNSYDFVKRIQGSATQYDDYFPKLRKYGMGDYKNITELGVEPDEMVTIYRGIDDVTGKIPKKINDGDFVTTDYDSAYSYAGDNVVSMEVPAKTLYTDAIDDFKSEPFYTGSEYVYTKEKVTPMSESQLTDIWNKANKLSDTINVADFAKKVEAELLPLKVSTKNSRLKKDPNADEYFANPNKYENVALPSELRGNIKNYKENIYESPIKTSAGQTHFNGQTDNYFGHTRIEDMADNKTRRVIEVQSDLYQKGNLEREGFGYSKPKTQAEIDADIKKLREVGQSENQIKGLMKPLYDDIQKAKDLSKLQQYNDPTAHFRMIREEIKKAAQDGKTKLQFPTGETAMKIEGLGDNVQFYDVVRMNETRANGMASDLQRQGEAASYATLKPTELKVGQEVSQGAGNQWIITDVLGDGKFKAVPKWNYDEGMKIVDSGKKTLQEFKDNISRITETFDISGKIDTNNPIYKFYEKDVQKYLNKFGGKKVVDDKGVSWIEVPITKQQGLDPVEAFGKVQLGAVTKIGIGTAVGAAGVSAYNKRKTKLGER